MRAITTWPILIIAVACSRDVPPRDRSRTDTASRTTVVQAASPDCARQAAIEDASEQSLIACAGGRVRRSGDTLAIAIPGQRDALFVDNNADGEGVMTYLFNGSVGDGNYWMVRIETYESAAMIVIDAKSGKRSVMIAPPVVAPGGRDMAAAARDLATAEGATGLEIWHVAPDSLVREFSVYPYDSDSAKSWGPGAPIWKGDDTLMVPRYRPGETEGSERLSDTIRFVRIGSGWVMNAHE